MGITIDMQDDIEQTKTRSDAPMCAANPEAVAVLKSMVNRSVQSVLSYDSAIVVDCEDGVVTLRGFYANSKDRQKALRVALTNPCVERVVNRASLLSI